MEPTVNAPLEQAVQQIDANIKKIGTLVGRNVKSTRENALREAVELLKYVNKLKSNISLTEKNSIQFLIGYINSFLKTPLESSKRADILENIQNAWGEIFPKLEAKKETELKEKNETGMGISTETEPFDETMNLILLVELSIRKMNIDYLRNIKKRVWQSSEAKSNLKELFQIVEQKITDNRVESVFQPKDERAKISLKIWNALSIWMNKLYIDLGFINAGNYDDKTLNGIIATWDIIRKEFNYINKFNELINKVNLNDKINENILQLSNNFMFDLLSIQLVKDNSETFKRINDTLDLIKLIGNQKEFEKNINPEIQQRDKERKFETVSREKKITWGSKNSERSIRKGITHIDSKNDRYYEKFNPITEDENEPDDSSRV